MTSHRGEILAFSPPTYLGVTESTRRFFRHWFPLDSLDLLLPRDQKRFVDAVVLSEPAAIVFSGFDDGYESVLRTLRRRLPRLPIFVLWHSSPMQLVEACSRRFFDAVLSLARDGVVSRVGCFKSGMGEMLEGMGIDGADVFNPPPVVPPRFARDSLSRDSDTIKLGIFVAGPSWRKNPYAMITGAGQLKGSWDVSISGILDEPARDWAESIGLSTDLVSPTALDRSALELIASRQHCNLYVSLSECSPLFPIESLHWRVPCLIGPTSHLFSRSPVLPPSGEDSAGNVESAALFLEDRLVVARPDDPFTISSTIERAIEATEEILTAYETWHPAYRSAALDSMDRLLGTVLPRVEAS